MCSLYAKCKGVIFINKNSPIPLYYQVKEDIIKKIKNGEYKVEDSLPGERELVRIYDVSTITIRKALSELVNEGYLYRIQGKGTYVAKPKIDRVLTISSFTDELLKKGLNPGTKILNIIKIKNKFIANELGIGEDEEIVKFERLRYADDVPIAIQTSYISTKILNDKDIEELGKYNSLYKFLSEKNIYPKCAKENYSVALIEDKEKCTLLDIKKNSPCFIVKRHTYDNNGAIFEYAESTLRGDRYNIEVELKSNI